MGDTMNPYEVVFSFPADISEERINAFCDQLKKMLNKRGGEVISLEKWGRKRLSQPIKSQKELYYCCLTFTAPGDFIPELENQFKISSDVVTHIIIRLQSKDLELKREQKGGKDGRPSDAGAEQSSSSGKINQGS